MKNLFSLFTILFFSSSLFAQNWEQINSGTEFSLALRSDSTAWSFGNNGNGQLGHGNLTNTNEPVQIGTEHIWKAVIAGSFHSLLLHNNGSLWVCGLNGNGQLGLGNTTQVNSPVQIGSRTVWIKADAG
ncbi:RCC1 domain-containing protein, partial [Candidatus Venteria ishoeyi]|uniref:RCC1 domain-containing protein n=1 Tax=Candidatus Venteria ishoeyi TaxID=1899563 RepID=UPI00255C9BDF